MSNKLVRLNDGPYAANILIPCHPAEMKLSLIIVVTQNGNLELAGPVNDENLCLLLLDKAKERIKQVHRGQAHRELVIPS